VRTLTRQAIQQGGKDNISVVLVEGPDFGGVKRTPATRKEVVPIRPTREDGQTLQLPSFIPQPSRWQRIAWVILWMALGAALFFGGQQGKKLLTSRQPPAPPPQKVPSTILVNAAQPGAQPTIATALAVAAEGDTIQLAPGLYDEPVKIEKSNLLIDGSGALLRPKPTAEGSDGITINGAAGIRLQNMRISGDSDGNLLTGIRIVNSQVNLRNVHVVLAAGPGIEVAGTSTFNMDAASIRDSSGPGLLLRDAAAATLKYSSIVGNGREAGDHQPGILLDSARPMVLVGNTIANNGGPAITQASLPSPELLSQNLFSLDGRKGRMEDVRVNRKRVKP